LPNGLILCSIWSSAPRQIHLHGEFLSTNRIGTVFSNLKTWILGTHHGAIAQHHLQAYLNEYVFRFNRRFYPMTSFNSVLGIAARSTSATYDQLYSGSWKHPAS
jgi:hypothetical protein